MLGGNEMSLKNRIHELRKKNNMSQEQLAEKIGVARQTISKWELGETAPDIKQAYELSKIFNVTLDELLGDVQENNANIPQDNSFNQVQKNEKRPSPWTKFVAIGTGVIFVFFIIFGILSVINRTNIIHPEVLSKTIVITRQGQAQIKKRATGVITYKEDGKPAIACKLPEGFTKSKETLGLYTDGLGNYIKFNAEYEEGIINPLIGTEYYSYYTDYGFDSYLDLIRIAMYYDIPKEGIFASKKDIYLAGGAQLIRNQVCAGKNADYYELSGELTSYGDEMLISGFALHFDDSTWLVTLKDYEDNYYFITVKDPNGIGKNIESLTKFLSTIYAGDALRYFRAKDSAAMQTANAAYKEYYAIDLSDDGKLTYKYFIYKTNDGRFVAIQNGIEKIFDNLQESLDWMLENADTNRLVETSVDNLWAYKQD